MEDFGEMNKVYTEAFGDHRPARSAASSPLPDAPTITYAPLHPCRSRSPAYQRTFSLRLNALLFWSRAVSVSATIDGMTILVWRWRHDVPSCAHCDRKGIKIVAPSRLRWRASLDQTIRSPGCGQVCGRLRAYVLTRATYLKVFIFSRGRGPAH